MTITRFSFPTDIHFGAGARKQVAAHLAAAGCKRPLIVTDRALAALPVMAEFRSHLGGLDVAVFDGVFGNPTCAQVMAGATAFKAHRADSVIGFGGGAALDVSKVVGLMAVHEGDVLRLKAPSGGFFIDPDAEVPVVLIGGGIGITPMMSMLRWCLAEQPARVVHLYYGLRNGREHAFKQTLEALAAAHPNLHLNVVYSRPDDGDTVGRNFQHRGHIDVELLRRTLPHGRHRFYVCGPPALMQSLVPALAAWGVARADLNFEAFGPASVSLPGDAPPPADTEAFEIRFSRSGRTLSWDGSDASLLDFAERRGVAVESGCRSGGCGACETRLIEGQVQYTQTPDHDVAPGHCLLCIGRPTSPLVLEA